MPDLPSGTVAFLFTDIEGSTALWERDRAAMGEAVVRHLDLLRHAVETHGGVCFKTVGDAVQAAFPTAPTAVVAAIDAQRFLLAEPWPDPPGPLRVRMALHAGEAHPDARGDYLAAPLNRLSRLLAAGHGAQILTSQAVQQLSRGALPEGVEARGLGEHRLRDLREPEVVFQVAAPGLPDAFPPLRSLPSHPTNLTSPPTSLIGREVELADISRVLDEGARLVTLTGPGGSGKTRLALEAAAEALPAFPGGVWFLDLASLTDPALLLGQIAAVLGVQERAERSLLEQLTSALAGRQTLLVLDNLEQFRPFAALARAVADLLVAAPDLSVLATSRVPLRLRAERDVPVPPLPVPASTETALDVLSASPAVALFIARADAARPGFALTPQTAPAIAELCRRLDGLPLAIELAAARVRALSPADILARLSDRLDLLADRGADRPDRQRTLEATIAWSYDLLASDEQAALRRLAVFSGFDLAAAEAVLGAVISPIADTLSSLELLIEQSLIRAEEQPDGSLRYGLLGIVRTFSRERLRESGEVDATCSAHAAYFAARDPNPWFALPQLLRLESDAGNLREALLWTEEQGDAETGLLLAHTFGAFAFQRGRLTEGREWLERLLALDGAASAGTHSKALAALGWTALFQGDTDAAETAAAALLALSATEPADRANILNLMAGVLWDRGDVAGTRQRFEEALAEVRAAPAAAAIAWSIHNNFGWWALGQGELHDARRHFEAALDALALEEVWYGRSITLSNLAALDRLEGNQQRSAVRIKEALALTRTMGNRYVVASLLDDAAHHALTIGRAETAARLLGAADTLHRVSGHPVDPQNVAEYDRLLARIRNDVGETAFAAAWEQGQALPMDQAIIEAERVLAEAVAAPRPA